MSSAGERLERRGKRTTETDAGGLLAILRRHVWKIVLSTLAATLLALTYLALATPVYTAAASLFVDPRARKVVSEEVAAQGYGTDLALLESQVAIISSDAVLKRVVEKLSLDTDPAYAPPPRQGLMAYIKSLIKGPSTAPNPKEQAVRSLGQSIKVKRAQKTYVIDVEVSSPSRLKAQQIAEGVVEAYLADQTAAKAAEARRANALIDARLGELREQVRQAETLVDDFKKANKILTAEGGVVTEQQLTKFNTELVTARAVAAEAKARKEQVVAALRQGLSPDTLPDAVRSSLVQRLREQYAQVARREAALSSQLQPRHPVLIEVRSQLAEVKSQINAEMKRVEAVSDSDYQVAHNRELEVARQLEAVKDDVSKSNTAQIKLRELEQEATASRELLRLFLSRAKETQEQVNTSTPDARVITPPALPERPSKPIAWLVLGLGLFGGLGLGVASALVLDHLDTRIRTSGDVANVTGIRALTALPALSAGTASRRRLLQQRARGVDDSQFSDLLSAIADTQGKQDAHYRQGVLRLLGKLKAQQRPGRPHVVMFAAAALGSGNSATTLAVAYAAALAGERVLLVDATSTNPELSRIFATTLSPTNVVALDNKEHLARITTRDGRSGLAFLPIALADLRSLKSQQRRRLVAGLTGLIQSFDLVFIDAGGVLEDEAALCLMPVADQIQIVARRDASTRAELAQLAEVLDAARDRITGAVVAMAG